MKLNDVILINDSCDIYKKLLQVATYVHKNLQVDYNQFFFTNNIVDNKNYIEVFIKRECSIKKDLLHNINGIVLLDQKSFNEAEDKFGVKGNLYLEEFYCITNELAINILENSRDYSEILDNALDLLLITSIISYGSIERGYLSFMSHSNGFFTRFNNMQEIRGKFENKYENLSPLIQEKIIKAEDNEFRFETYYQLIKPLKELKHRAVDEFKSKKLEFPLVNKEVNPDTDILYRSEFHNEISNNKEFLQYMNEDVEFLSSRLLTIFSYLFIKKIGVKNHDRYLLAYLIYRGVEELYKIEGIEVIKNFRL